MLNLFRQISKIFKYSQSLPDLDQNNIPQHVAIIMDGNGRWAQRRGMPRIAGHKEGVEALRRCVAAAAEIGIKYLTVYAFSTENWFRPKEEVSFLMGLLAESIDRFVEELNKNNVRLRFLGRIDELQSSLQDKIKSAQKLTGENTGLNLSVLLNYGGRREIVDAAVKIVDKIKNGKNVEFSEEEISSNTYLGEIGIPDPDILIRPGGDKRISNFLLWESAYTEFYLTQTLWPDFRREQLIEAVTEFQGRNRRFGRVASDERRMT